MVGDIVFFCSMFTLHTSLNSAISIIWLVITSNLLASIAYGEAKHLLDNGLNILDYQMITTKAFFLVPTMWGLLNLPIMHKKSYFN